MSAPDYTKIESPTDEWRQAELNRRRQLSRAAFYKELLPLMQALAAGADVEELDLIMYGEQSWRKPTSDVLALGFVRYIYRIKQQPSQPKWIPWTIDTAPTLPILVRRKGETTRRLVIAIHEVGVSTAAAHISYGGLLADYEFTSALFCTFSWKPCGTLTDTNENKS